MYIAISIDCNKFNVFNNYLRGKVYFQHQPIVVSISVTWHLIIVLYLVLSAFLSRAWLMCFFAPCFTKERIERWGKHVLSRIPSHKTEVTWTHDLIVRPRVLHVKTNLPQSWQQMNELRSSLVESAVRIKTVPTIPTTSCRKENKQNARLTSSPRSLK